VCIVGGRAAVLKSQSPKSYAQSPRRSGASGSK
jgi:hypothetical protein